MTPGQRDALEALARSTSFFSSFFNGLAEPGTYAWEFYYAAPGHGTWANTDHGNTGEIIG